MNPDFQPAELASSLWTMSPFHLVDRMGIEPNAPTLQGSVAPLEHASPFLFWLLSPCDQRSASVPVATGDRARLKVRPGIEPGPRPYHGRVRPKHLQTNRNQVIADGVEPSLSWMSTRRRNRWTTRSKVTRVGVEPTNTRLSTSSLCQFAYLVMAGSGVAPDKQGL